jgi:Zn-dependent alcohol dehydrogenase
MAIRNVLKTYTFEEQRLQINLVGADVGDAATLTSSSKVLVTAINAILSGSEPFDNLTTSGDLTVQGGDINLSNAATKIAIKDNTASSFSIAESTNNYLTIDTTDLSEKISLLKNTSITGTLDSTGDFKINTNKFTVAASTGNTLVAGTLDSTGDFKINTNKFTVAASTGNTSVAGTLTVTDDVTLNKNVSIVGSDTAATELFKIKNGSSVDKFTVDSSSGNTLVAGTLDSTGDFKINTNKFTVAASTGNTLVSGTLSATGDFKINTNKFTVAATSGNTLVAGTLDSTGDFKINTDKFTVTATNGNTSIAGSITNSTTLGLLTNLITDSKTTFVDAINEVKDEALLYSILFG